MSASITFHKSGPPVGPGGTAGHQGRCGFREVEEEMVEDGLWVVFLLKEQALVPTMAKTKAGFYMGIEPVEVVDVHDKAALEQAIIRVVKRGNPSVPTPLGGANFPKSPLLKYTKLKSRSSFDRVAKSWKLSKREGAYLIVPYRPRKDSGAEEDTERGEAIPAEEPLEAVVRRLVHRALKSDKQG